METQRNLLQMENMVKGNHGVGGNDFDETNFTVLIADACYSQKNFSSTN